MSARPLPPADSPDEPPPHEITAATFALDTVGDCFVVATGEVRIFAASAADAIARRPIARIGAGGLLFGVGTSFFGDETLIAVRSRDTHVFQLPGRSWAVAQPSETFADGLDTWIATVIAGVARVIEPKPRADVVVSPEAPFAVAQAGAVLGTHGRSMWARVHGSSRLLGLETLSPGLVPLTASSWLVLDADAPIESVNWQDGLADDDWHERLDVFHEAIVELLPLVRGLGEADEFNRLTARRAAERHAEHDTAGRFADVLGNPLPPSGVASTEPLLDVMRRIGKTLDMAIEAPVRARQAQVDRPATAQEIARASKIRLQPARLKNDWWRADGGAFLAERLTGEPVALLFRGGHYDEVDRHGSTRRVTAATAAELSPSVWTLFKPQRPGKASFANLFFDSLKGSQGDLLGFFATMLVGSLLAQVLPMATGFILGVLAPSAMTSQLTQVGVAIVMIGVVGYLLQVGGEIAKQRVQARSNGELYCVIWDRIASLPLSYFRTQGSAELVGRAGSAISVPTGVQIFLFTAAGSLGMMVSSLITLLLNHPLIALVALGLVIVQVGIGALAGYLQARAYLNGEQLEGLADSLFVQMINGLVKLRSAGAEDRAVTRWGDRFAAMRRRMVKARRVMNAYEATLTALSLLSAAVLFAVVHLLNQGDAANALPVAKVVATLTAFAILLSAVGQLTAGFLSVWMLAPSWKYALPLLEKQPEPTAGRSDPGELTGALEFSNVQFRYGSDGTVVFGGLSFKAAPGEMIAIVGPSGCGKSTLVRLALGLETPSSGAVYVDGQDLRSMHPAAYRAQVGVVLQDGALPPGTLFEIVRGTSNATVDDIWRALAQAAVAEDVAAMPMGIHTLLHDATRTLSGGQVQRLALARAFVQQPPILILDEATSALDNTTQAIAMRTILGLSSTRIVIAHRISTIRQADRILVLGQGKVAEAGSYDELVALDGAFAKLAKA